MLLVILTTLLLVAGGSSVVMLSAKSLPLDKMEEIQFASTIYDKKGKPVTRLGSNQREYVKMKDVVSRKLIEEAFVAVEDRRFYSHHGVDFKAIARALVRNVIQGRKAQGASTITMQVARNVVLENTKKTYTRKLKEIAVAWNLERDYSKNEILEAYLNYIYFGNEVQGIQMAAKIYFGKDLTKDKLEPKEAALLAGMPKAPSRYDPYRNPDKAKERRNVVLMVMAEQGIISEAEKEKYQKADLGVNRKYLKKYVKSDHYQAYKHYVMNEAEERFGIPEEELATGGYQIRTTLDAKAQRAMEKAFKNDSLFHNRKELDGGATILDPKTGGVAAIAGGREYLGRGYILRSTDPGQPGSAIKPITVYAPAVQEKEYNEYTPVKDPPGFQVGNWKPKNFQGRYYGEVPLKEVLAKSLNVATAWLLTEKVGLDTAAQYAERMGLNLEAHDKSSPAALGLGGLTKGVDTVQMAQAYSAFDNNGRMTDAHAIEKITTQDKEWEPRTEIEKNQEVLTPKTAWYLTRMMRYNVQQGTGQNAQLPDGRDVAGKTGTTQGSKRAWFVGYTREYVMAATVYNTENGQVELSGGKYPARIFRKVMAETLEGTPVSRFVNPGVEEPKPPFVLKAVDLKGAFDPGSRSIRLSWNDYSDRLQYRVERSEDGSNWTAIGQTEDGAWSDTNIEIPPPGDPFGGVRPTYTYRVIAIDTESNKEADPSNTLTVQVSPPIEEPPPPPGNEEGDEAPGDQRGDQQPGDQLGDQGGGLPGGDQQGGQGEQGGQGQQGNQGDDITIPEDQWPQRRPRPGEPGGR
ncbi:PBP1A family penicillin-binding protein [Salinithrix halophila]|uniref:PBP1A family penicillin-binding protein n=2 Tax=Salinithrix halophila TaxID=1485204 RepID=A0ABV8JE29_9BACL